MWEPVATAGVRRCAPPSGERIAHGVLADIETSRDAQLLDVWRARRSASLKTTRVTAGGPASVMDASASSSMPARAIDVTCHGVLPQSPQSRYLAGVLPIAPEPLRDIRRHPDDVASVNRMPG